MMIEKVQDSSIEPALRCALVGILTYLVRSEDLIPDDSPGGYGYIDACLLLRTALVEYINVVSLPSSKSVRINIIQEEAFNPDLAFEIYYDLKSAPNAAVLKRIMASGYYNIPLKAI